MIQRIEEKNQLRNDASNATKKYVSTSSLLLDLAFFNRNLSTINVGREKITVVISVNMNSSTLPSRVSVQRRLKEAEYFAEAAGKILPRLKAKYQS